MDSNTYHKNTKLSDSILNLYRVVCREPYATYESIITRYMNEIEGQDVSIDWAEFKDIRS